MLLLRGQEYRMIGYSKESKPYCLSDTVGINAIILAAEKLKLVDLDSESELDSELPVFEKKEWSQS